MSSNMSSWTEKCLKKLNRCNEYLAVTLYAALTMAFIMGWLYIYFHLLMTRCSYIIIGGVVFITCAIWMYGSLNLKSKFFIPVLIILASGALVQFNGHFFIISDLIAGSALTEAEFRKTWWTWFLHYQADSYTPYFLAIFIYLMFDLLFYIFFTGHLQTFLETQRKPKNISYLDREICLSVVTV